MLTPAPALRGIVARHTAFAGDGAPASFRPLPGSVVPLVVEIGDGWSVGDPRRPGVPPERVGSFVAGLTAAPVAVSHPGGARCLQIDLTPLGARRLLGVAMDEIAGRTVGLDAVLGAVAGRLAEVVAGAPSWEAAVAGVEAELLNRLRDAPAADPGTSWALAAIVGSGGRASIGALARELGWSHRRLIAGFRRDVGLPPKAVARIVRLERLQSLAGSPDFPGWARAAAMCGYADQSHLAREVGALTDMTPTALRAGAVNFVQDAEDGPS